MHKCEIEDFVIRGGTRDFQSRRPLPPRMLKEYPNKQSLILNFELNLPSLAYA